MCSQQKLSTSPLLSQSQSKFEDVWPEIDPLVQKLFTNDLLSKEEWQRIFWKVHITCIWDPKAGSKMQEKLVEAFQMYVDKEKKLFVNNSQDDLTLLKTYLASWKRFKFLYTFVPLPFSPLERVKPKHSPSSSDRRLETDNYIKASMIEMWVQNIFSEVSVRIVTAAMALVDGDRNNCLSDAHLVTGLKESCIFLCTFLRDKLFLYRSHYEMGYILSLQNYYHARGSEYYSKHGILAYIKWTDLKIKEEIERCNRYLESHSLNKVIAACVQTLITKYIDVIADQFPILLQQKDTVYLKLIHTLLDRTVEGIPMLVKAFKNFLHRSAATKLESIKIDSSILQDSKNYIESIIAHFVMATDMVDNALNGDHRFLTARDMTFMQLLNEKNSIAPSSSTSEDSNSNVSVEVRQVVESSNTSELFANYSDMLLRKTTLSKHLTSDQVDSKLTQMLQILKYIQDKDVFMKLYQKHLTRRLILESSVDSDKEEQMVNWMREVGMPADLVHQISRMFQDVNLSRDFSQLINDNLDDINDMISVKILNPSTWSRSYEKINVSLPLEIEEKLLKIESYYKSQHSGRNLIWHHQFSTAVITFHSDYGTYDFDVTSFQAAVLFSWNLRPEDSISLEELTLATQLPVAELRRSLWSLVSNPKLKTQLIQVVPSETAVQSLKDLCDSTRFKLNTEFVLLGKHGRPMKRGRMSLIGRLPLQNEKSREEEAESIVRLRELRTQEAIIRVLKTRKSMLYADLQLELINVLKQMFIPSKSIIEAQLEWLIEQQYIMRSPSNNQLFLYNTQPI